MVAGFPTVVQDSGTGVPFYGKAATSSSGQPSATGVTQACLEHSTLSKDDQNTSKWLRLCFRSLAVLPGMKEHSHAYMAVVRS